MSFLQKLSASIVIVLFTTIIVLDLFVHPEYSFDDSPYFEYRGLLFGLALVLGAVIVFASIMKLGKLLSWNPILPILFYIIASLAFLWAVPMVPVSDQAAVFFLASNKLVDPFNYMSTYSNTIPTIMYLLALVSVFGNSLWVPKIANVVWGLMTLILTAKVYGLLAPAGIPCRDKARLFFSEAECKLLWIGAVFLPAFFYNNHVYNEVPSVALGMLLLYLVVRNDDRIWIRIITVIVSFLQMSLRQTGIILIIAVAMYVFFYQKKRIYAIVYLACSMMGYFLISKCCGLLLVDAETQGFPIWSWVKMGINEAEIGFQDNTHSYDVTFQDVVDRYQEYGLYKVLTILGRKTFWIWGEGTYQSGRYGYGVLNNEYLYETFVTARISESPERILRVTTNFVLRAQYLFYMLFALLGTLRAQKKHEFSVLFYIFCGFLVFYLVWEIKSRYLYGLYPMFMILALYGWESEENPVRKIPGLIKNRAPSK